VQYHRRVGQAWDEDGVKNRPRLRPREAKMSQEESKRDQDTARQWFAVESFSQEFYVYYHEWESMDHRRDSI